MGQFHIPITRIREGNAQCLGHFLIMLTQAPGIFREFGIIHPRPQHHRRRRNQKESTGRGLLEKNSQELFHALCAI